VIAKYTGRSIAEASSRAVPRLSFNDSGAAQTICAQCTGWLVPERGKAGFARAVRRCVSTASDAETRALVRHSATRFDARMVAEEIADAIRRAAGPTS
jgi:glycosyltransferase involved in cell wall biosynthesis